MTEKSPLRSEGAELDTLLDELQAEHDVKEISGWESGFANLSRALDGIRPGLCLLIGPPACGKTSFAKQLLDQVTLNTGAPGIFFSFVERKKELRIKTLARLSGIESREIRRGSAYLLHWYGVPKRAGAEADADQLPPGWEKLRRVAEKARPWLDRVYLVECDATTTPQTIKNRIEEVKQITGSEKLIAVIDDAHYLGAREQPMRQRMPRVAEELQAIAVESNAAIIAVWPDLQQTREASPHAWADVAPADVILAIEPDARGNREPSDLKQAVMLHVVKNRGGERGALAFDFFPPFCRFEESPT